MTAKVSLGVLAIIFGTAHIAYAQSECVEVARVLGQEFEKIGDSDQVAIIQKANLCEKEFDNESEQMKAQIKASYAAFNGDASGDHAKVKAWHRSHCEEKYGSYWRDKISSREVRRASETAAKVIASCFEQSTFRLVDLTIQNEGIAATFKFGGNGSTTVHGFVQRPQNIANCTFLHNGTEIDTKAKKEQKLTVSANDIVVLQCERSTESPATAPRKHYKGGIIGVASISGAPMIPLVEYSVPPISEDVAAAFRSRIEQLEGKVTAAEGKIKEISGTVKTHSTELSKKLSSVTASVKYVTEPNGPVRNGWIQCIKLGAHFASSVYLDNRGINAACSKIELNTSTQ